MNPIKIIQFTDMHLPEDEKCWEGIDLRQQFRNCWKTAVTAEVSFVVLSGDIADWDGEEGAYLWLKEFLDNETNTPYLIMSGNHDRVSEIKRIFGDTGHFKGNSLYGHLQVEGAPLYFLDTTTDITPKEQLDWIERGLKTSGPEVLFFMHHPPILTGHQFMDSLHCLQNHHETWRVLKGIDRIKNIFVGHYHYEDEIVKDGKTVYVTPSAKMQIDPTEKEFKILSVNPGWREITWSDQGVETRVVYLNP